MFFSVSSSLFFKKIKKRPTKKENIEKNKTNPAVFNLEASKVPSKTPNYYINSKRFD